MREVVGAALVGLDRRDAGPTIQLSASGIVPRTEVGAAEPREAAALACALPQAAEE